MKLSPIRIIWILIVICFALIVFPGVYFINRIYPHILHIPFIYWFPLLIWAVLCALLFIGYKLRWKSKKK